MSETLELQRKSKITLPEYQTPTFNEVPVLLAEVNRKLDLLLSKPSEEEEKDRLFSVEQLQNYLPENPARQTIYGWVNNRLIPFEKHGPRLYFRKSKIDHWSENGRQML